MQRNNRELWLALFAIVVITFAYLLMVAVLRDIPSASGFFGHSIGILGFLLMLMTETLYSIRKRSRSARWGRMADWLKFHIFTGIVGPYLVLLHTSWKFNGLAGVVSLMTLIVVISGFIGRYIYTAIPRTADGAEMEAANLEQRIAAGDAALRKRLQAQPELARILQPYLAAPGAVSSRSSLLALAPSFSGVGRKLRWWSARRKLAPDLRKQVEQMMSFASQQEILQRQMGSLALARRLMAVWHSVHIPLGMALFTAAFIHIVAAIYYATLLR